MKTLVIKESDQNSIQHAVSILQNNGVIAVPTDTVYGIACLVSNNQSIRRLYQIKERDQLKAIPVLIGNFDQLKILTRSLSTSSKILSELFWPGALTIVIEKHPGLPQDLSTYDTVGVRMPNHDWLRSLIDECGPIAATSANISGQPSTTTAKDVLATLNERIDLLIDGGTCAGGIPSTVVDCTTNPVKILRKGTLSEEAIYSTISNGLEKGEKNDI